MTKADLIELLSDVPDDAEIGAFFDGSECDINGVINSDSGFYILIDCGDSYGL